MPPAVLMAASFWSLSSWLVCWPKISFARPSRNAVSPFQPRGGFGRR